MLRELDSGPSRNLAPVKPPSEEKHVSDNDPISVMSAFDAVMGKPVRIGLSHPVPVDMSDLTDEPGFHSVPIFAVDGTLVRVVAGMATITSDAVYSSAEKSPSGDNGPIHYPGTLVVPTKYIGGIAFRQRAVVAP